MLNEALFSFAGPMRLLPALPRTSPVTAATADVAARRGTVRALDRGPPACCPSSRGPTGPTCGPTRPPFLTLTVQETNYHFDCNVGALGEALDRFAQFFIGPLISADAVEREVKAVHSECAGPPRAPAAPLGQRLAIPLLARPCCGPSVAEADPATAAAMSVACTRDWGGGGSCGGRCQPL